MFSLNRHIDVNRLEIREGGTAKHEQGKPLQILRNDQKLVIALPQDSKGYQWTPDDYLILDCKGQQFSKLNVAFKFHVRDKVVTLHYDLLPMRRVKMAVKLDELASKRFFLQTRPGSFKGGMWGYPTHIDKVDDITLEIQPGRKTESLTIYDLYVSPELPDFTVKGDPMVDQFGQWKEMEWPHKIHDEETLVSYLRQEYQLALQNHDFPQGFSKYGGCLDIKFQPKGRFYLKHDGKRWWLVDPDGYAFFSSGICYASRMGVHGFVDGMEDMFDFLPDRNDPTFHDAWTTADQIPEFVKRNGAEAGRNRRMFNFARANMIRAFGDNWWKAWHTINVARMKRWGFNTISVCVNNYFDEKVEDYLNQAHIPFTWTLKQFPKTQHMIFRDFPDVFSPEYEDLSRHFAQQLTPFSDNPYFIGYFINNEPEWLFARDTNLAAQLLEKHSSAVSKSVMIQWLQDRYQEVEAFNRAWNQKLSSFNQLNDTTIDCTQPTEQASRDLADFRAVLLEKYCRVPTDELRKVCPQALNLGMRYSSVKEDDFAGDSLFDMFSTNNYTKDPQQMLDLVNRCTKMPIIVGEWHYGGSDRGLLSNALVNATTQLERGKACANYLQKTMANPQCVGVHYFEFNDQPLLGRFDGECMQHGLIDICNHPHEDCVRQMADINKNMYKLCTGEIKPTILPWQFNPQF